MTRCRAARTWRRVLGGAGLVAALACARRQSPAATAEPGLPLPGLAASLVRRFEQGRALFRDRFTPARGLGPLFNEDRCSSCHDLPSLGGTGVESELKATRFVPPDWCDLLTSRGGDVFEANATPALQRLGIRQATVPEEATARARLIPPELFGLGLVEAIPDSTLRALAASEARAGTGRGGRPGRTADGRVGRFGHKADQATIQDFVQAALIGEMGLTSPRYPSEKPVAGGAMPRGADPAPDPEITAEQVARLADFVRLLAPTAPAVPASPAARDSVRRGERVFERLGCPDCHVALLRTGPSPVAALDHKAVRLYSDLLLHDLGSAAAGVCSAGARPSDVRTARLAGLRFRTAYMSDGQAPTLETAIARHGGQAAAGTEAFRRLSETDRRLLFAFLGSL